MSVLRRGWVRGALVWTLCVVVAATVLAVQAAWSLADAQQACFFGYPAVPCPSGDDPAVVRLTVAFFAAPLVWLAGLVAGALWRWRRGWH